MRNIFLITLFCLIVFSQYMSFRGRIGLTGTDLPVLYWATEADPQRPKQIKLFRSWLKSKGYPDIDLRIDAANRGIQKQFIQGVSGVASDLIQVSSEGIETLSRIGILADLGSNASSIGLSEDKIYQPIRSTLLVDDKWVAYPFNVTVTALLVNRRLFKSLGLEPPSKTWTVEEFTRLGREFDRRANKPGKRRDHYFCQTLNVQIQLRSYGLDLYNETMTGSGLDHPEAVKVFKQIKEWVQVDHLIPSAGDFSSFSVEQSGNSELELFAKGVFGMVLAGRMSPVVFRRMGATNLDVAFVNFPHGNFPNTIPNGRMIGVFSGSHQKIEALRFMEFLLSPEFNIEVAAGSDTFPPDPHFYQQEIFLKPKDFPYEWDLHQSISEIARTTAFARVLSPYVLTTVVSRIVSRNYEACLSGVVTAEDAVKKISLEVDREIRSTVDRNPSLKDSYLKALSKQNVIEKLKGEGKHVPIEWIDNAYLRKFRENFK